MPKTNFNQPLLKQAYLHLSGNQRQATSSTKTRGRVSGGGRKPWKQKGTGRARAGSSRSPIWSGGGIVFGPQANRSFTTRLPKKMLKAAFRQLLEFYRREGKIITLPNLRLSEPKTKLARTLLKKLDLTSGRLLLITDKLEPELILGTNNLPGVETVTVERLTFLKLSSFDKVVMESAVFNRFFPLKKSPSTSKAKTTSRKVGNVA